MSAAAVMAIVVFAFFLVGVMVGIAVVAALSARKADRKRYRDRAEAVRDADRRRKSHSPV
jgi:MFS superfamily sulfate permease-like transporter